jgi:hypothetical protein
MRKIGDQVLQIYDLFGTGKIYFLSEYMRKTHELKPIIGK